MIIVYPIVEGHGDERAIPVLIRRLLAQRFSFYEVNVLHPYRLPKGKMLQADQWPGVINLACERLKDTRQTDSDTTLILVVCDADDDCPVELKAQMDAHAAAANCDAIFEVVVAQREYESWFLAAATSFVGHADCREDIAAVNDILSIRDAKGYFERNILRDGKYYSETVDQPKFSAVIGFDNTPEKDNRSLRRLIDVFSKFFPN
ncbi:DUF4276 family protein [Shinella sp.]|uniref:DUF4276 family protein n=1 Tax=Shinella sp. TaxID=1870904 RepID=UPI0039E2C53C